MSPAAADRLIIAVLGLGMIVSFASGYYLMGVLADPLAAGVGVPTATVFAALSAAFLLSACLGPWAGRWTDRRGGREVLSAAALLFAAALVVLGLAQGLVGMVAGLLLLGAGMGIGMYGPACAVLVVRHGEAANRPIIAISLIGAFGGAVGWPLTTAMIEAFGWRGACFAWAGAHLLLCLPLYAAALPDGRTGGRPPATGKVRWDATMIRLAVLFAGAWWVSTALGAHLPRLLGRLGLDAADAALAASAMAGAAIVVRLFALWAAGRASPVLFVRIATLSHPLGASVALTAGKSAAVAVALGQGIGNGLISVASNVLPLHLFGRENYAARQALMVTPARFIQSAAPVMFSVLLDRSAGLALAVTSGVCLTMFVMTLGLRRKVGV